MHLKRALILAAIWLAAGASTRAQQGPESPDGVFAAAEQLRNQSTAESLRAAIQKFDEAAAKYRAAGDNAGLAKALIGAGRAYDSLVDRTRALEYFEKALDVRRTLGAPDEDGPLLNYIGLAQDYLGRRDKARDSFQSALAIARRTSNRRLEAITLNNLGVLLVNIGDRQTAIGYYEQALSLNREVGNQRGIATTLVNLAIAHHYIGDRRKALSLLEEALPLQRKDGEHRDIALTLTTLGAVYRALDNLPQALSCFEQGLGEYRAGGDRNGEAADLHNIASIHEIRGEYQQAIEFYSQALPLHVLVKYYAGEANTLHNLAGVYAAMGDYVTALRHYENAREVHRSAGNPAGEATVLTSMAAAYAAARDGRKALEYYDKALPLLRKVSDRGGEATALTNAGRAYAALGENESARDSLASALDLHRSAESRRGQATALAALGPVSDALGNTEEAVHQEEQALQLFREIGDRRGEASALYSLGRLAAAHGRLGPARIQLESALDIVESLRTRVDTQELRSSYLASTREYYELFIDTLMQLDAQQPREGWARKAFEISESARARSLVETLVESVAAIREGVDSSVLERERQLQDQLNAKADRQARLLLGKHSQEEAAAIAKEIATLTSSYRDVEAEIRVKSPRYAALTQPRPVTISEIQQHLLDPDTLLLEYALGEDRSYLWVVSQTDVTTYVLRGRAEIEARARRFYEASKTNSSAQEWRVSAVSLADAILAPASTQLARKRLAIVADGALQYVPFAALPLSKAGPDASLTVSTKETVMLPSASTLGVLRQEFSARPSAPRQLAVIADPVFSADDPRLPAATATRFASSAQKAQGVTSDLARSLEETGFSLSRLIGSRREATAIARLVPRSSVRQLLDFDANRNVALSPEIGNYQILHFATHGLLNSEHPELSGLVLSLVDAQGKPQNGFVRLHDIYNLKLRANLVVLSACQTGLGKDIKGEGLVGFTRGFMYAGAPRVVASLWKVDDRATAELMKRFYAAMFGQEHRSPAAALRQAQQALAADSRWSAPYYWAAFVLQGDWN